MGAFGPHLHGPIRKRPAVAGLYAKASGRLPTGFLHVVLDIADLALRGANVLFGLAFQFGILAARGLAGSFLDGAFRFLAGALHLILVHSALLCSELKPGF